MASEKRRIEVFTAGCLICEDTVNLVKSLACPHCDVRVNERMPGQGAAIWHHDGASRERGVLRCGGKEK